MNAEYDSLVTPGPELSAYDQLMQQDDDTAAPAARTEGETAGSAYDEVLDSN
jgi:hypothetical protein